MFGAIRKRKKLCRPSFTWKIDSGGNAVGYGGGGTDDSGDFECGAKLQQSSELGILYTAISGLINATGQKIGWNTNKSLYNATPAADSVPERAGVRRPNFHGQEVNGQLRREILIVNDSSIPEL